MMSQPLVLHGAASPPLSEHMVAPSSFPQSGQWSWSDLGGKVITGAIAVLSRFSEGGIDPFTTVVGQLVCKEFKLGRAGTSLFLGILRRLQCTSTLGDVLHFGFGVDSIVRNLSATTEGGILVILTAALGECYHENHAADILWELVQIYKPSGSDDRTPSPSQWLAVVRQCSGVLATDEFSKLAEHFMRLHPQNSLISKSDHERRGVSSPNSIADALLAVGKVSTRQLESITISGGADAGWLAALAHRFFNLRVAIYNPKGELLYRNFDDQGRVQIKVLYEYSHREAEGEKEEEVEVLGRLFRLSDAADFLQRKDGALGSALLCGRVPWQNALSLTFGPAFRKLMESPTIFGQLVGAAARIFEAVAKPEKGIHNETLRACPTYLSSSRGQGLISSSILRFPELLPLRTHMETASNGTFQETQSTYESNLANVKRMCQCTICEAGIDDIILVCEESLCLVILTEAIIVLLRAVSSVEAPDDLAPVRAGIESFYDSQIVRHQQHLPAPHEVIRYGQVAFVLDLPFTGGADFFKENATSRRLGDATRLFTGRGIPRPTRDRSAISVAGICVYLDILINISNHPEALGLCKVIPGKIELAGRSYGSAEDISDFELGGMEYRRRREHGDAPKPLDDPSSLIAGYHSFSVAAQPSVNGLLVGLLVNHPSTASILLGPARLTNGILEASGLIRCAHRSQPTSKRRSSDSAAARQIHLDEGLPVWKFHGSLLSQIVAYSRIQELGYHVVWKHHECQQCCAASASPDRPTLVIEDDFE